MTNVKKLVGLAVLSFLGFTVAEVRAASKAEIASIDATLADTQFLACYTCGTDSYTQDVCQVCHGYKSSNQGQTECTPSGNPAIACTLGGRVCVLDPCPG